MKMNEDDDFETLEDVRRFSSTRNRSFSAKLNSKNLSEEELDDLFLA